MVDVKDSLLAGFTAGALMTLEVSGESRGALVFEVSRKRASVVRFGFSPSAMRPTVLEIGAASSTVDVVSSWVGLPRFFVGVEGAVVALEGARFLDFTAVVDVDAGSGAMATAELACFRSLAERLAEAITGQPLTMVSRLNDRVSQIPH